MTEPRTSSQTSSPWCWQAWGLLILLLPGLWLLRLLTAAHASLPIGSVVRVTVADTGRSVIVTINDRPGTRKRIIDLSRAAAIELGILSRGIAQVTLTPT